MNKSRLRKSNLFLLNHTHKKVKMCKISYIETTKDYNVTSMKSLYCCYFCLSKIYSVLESKKPEIFWENVMRQRISYLLGEIHVTLVNENYKNSEHYGRSVMAFPSWIKWATNSCLVDKAAHHIFSYFTYHFLIEGTDNKETDCH